MIAVAITALFAVAAVASLAVLADCAVRGRNAFVQLRGQLARLESEPRIGVTVVQPLAGALPALRRFAMPTRPACRRARSRVPSLHAAA